MAKNVGQKLKGLGFDLTKYDRTTGYYDVKCSQCVAIVINGTPTHERGCPNKKESRR